MKRIVAVAFLLIAAPVAAQQPQAAPQRPPKPVAQMDAISKLDFMVGDWSGTGWMQMGPMKFTFRGTEKVVRKLDGTALLVEGAFLGKAPGSDVEIPVHTTLGVISFDPAAKAYRFATWLATGTSGVRDLEVLEDGKSWRWSLTNPSGGTMRYTTTFADGDWFEIGERSSDGKEWTKFFEMRLKK